MAYINGNEVLFDAKVDLIGITEVTTDVIVDGAVTTEKMADASVTFEKLKNGVGKNSGSGEIFNDYTNNKAGYKAHVEGQNNTGTGDSCHVEGANNIVTSGTGHAEGRQNNVDAPNGHAEGQGNIITKDAWSGHIEGQGSEIHGHTSHGGGFNCKVYARHGFAHGLWLIAGDVDNANDLSIAIAQSVFGRYNQPDLDALLIVGNGTGENKRRNAFAVKSDGRTVLGALPIETMDAVPKVYVDEIVAELRAEIEALKANPNVAADGE